MGCLIADFVACSFRVHNELNVALIGPKVDLAYEYKHLGDSPDIISQVGFILQNYLSANVEPRLLPRVLLIISSPCFLILGWK